MQRPISEYVDAFKRYWRWRKGIRKRRLEHEMIIEEFRRDLNL